jgi:hypothetical protein
MFGNCVHTIFGNRMSLPESLSEQRLEVGDQVIDAIRDSNERWKQKE